jgi:hypothetical protein
MGRIQILEIFIWDVEAHDGGPRWPVSLGREDDGVIIIDIIRGRTDRETDTR